MTNGGGGRFHCFFDSPPMRFLLEHAPRTGKSLSMLLLTYSIDDEVLELLSRGEPADFVVSNLAEGDWPKPEQRCLRSHQGGFLKMCLPKLPPRPVRRFAVMVLPTVMLLRQTTEEHALHLRWLKEQKDIGGLPIRHAHQNARLFYACSRLPGGRLQGDRDLCFGGHSFPRTLAEESDARGLFPEWVRPDLSGFNWDAVMEGPQQNSDIVLFTTYRSFPSVIQALREQGKLSAVTGYFFDEVHHLGGHKEARREFVSSVGGASQDLLVVGASATPGEISEKLLSPCHRHVKTVFEVFREQESNPESIKYINPFFVSVSIVDSLSSEFTPSERLVATVLRRISRHRKDTESQSEGKKERILRVKVYFSKYHTPKDADEEKKCDSAKFVGNPGLWRITLSKLHILGECTNVVEDDILVQAVGGESGDGRGKFNALEAFNSKSILAQSPATIMVLCSCQTVNEGVTLRRCDLVVFASPKFSATDIIQAALRGVRACGDADARDFTEILIPYMVPLSDSSSSSADALNDARKNFRPMIIQILSLLLDDSEGITDLLRRSFSQDRGSQQRGDGVFSNLESHIQKSLRIYQHGLKGLQLERGDEIAKDFCRVELAGTERWQRGFDRAELLTRVLDAYCKKEPEPTGRCKRKRRSAPEDEGPFTYREAIGEPLLKKFCKDLDISYSESLATKQIYDDFNHYRHNFRQGTRRTKNDRQYMLTDEQKKLWIPYLKLPPGPLKDWLEGL